MTTTPESPAFIPAVPAGVLVDRIVSDPELELVDSPLSGITFRYRSTEVAAHWYVDQLNRELFAELQGRRYLFFQDGGVFVLRLHWTDPAVTAAALLALVDLVVATGREVDAAMRASAFSH